MTTSPEVQASPVEQPSEYDNLWAQVRSSETFDNWAKLASHTLKLVRCEGDIEKTRTVCDEFLSKYPLCYGYWQQYASAEALHGDRAKVVYEQAVASTPYSPDIWGYYIEWLRKQEGIPAEDIRTLFGRALQYVGIDWHAFKIFDKWIAYEEEQQNLQQVAHVYSVAICTPTQELQRLNTSFLKFAAEHEVKEMLTETELQLYTEEAKKAKQSTSAAETGGVSGSAPGAAPANPDEEMAPGVDEAPPGEPSAPMCLDAVEVTDEEVKAAWLRAKAAAHQQTEAVCSKVMPYESVIRRRWWHWNALQAPQLAAWWQYLDAVAADGDESALYGLHERCLVPCASYPEFWCRYFAFLNSAKTLPDVGTILNYAITRATRVFCRARPEVHLAAAAVLDARATAAVHTNGQQAADGDASTAAAAAREALRTVANDIAPRSATVAARLAHYERRSGDAAAARAALLAKLDEARASEDAAAAAELARACVTLERSLAARSEGGAGADVAPDAGASGKENTAAGNGADEAPPGEEAAPGDKADASQEGVGAVLEKVLEKFPGNRGLWDAAIAEKELLPWGEARARAILDVYGRALSAKKGTGDPGAAGEEVSAATETSVNTANGSSAIALDLKIREAFVRSAIAAMDAAGTPALTWEAYLLMIRIWGEKFATEATSTQKRPAQAPAAGQPDPKRAAGADAAAAAAQMHAPHAAYGQHYQQQHAAAAYGQHYQQAAHQQYYGGYDYSAYYAANPQAAAYYGAYAYPPQQ